MYENPKPTTAVIFENKLGQILLIKRKKAPKKDYWDLPGGFVDLYENLESAVIREIKEELNIELADFKYIGSYYGRYLYRGVNYHTLCFAYVTKTPINNLKISDEIAEFKFFDKKEVPLDRVAFVEVKSAIRDYLSSSHQS